MSDLDLASRRASARRWLGMAWLAAGVFVPGANAQPAALALPWVDVHMHLVGGRGQQQDFGGAVDAAVLEMERFGIAMAIVLPPPNPPQLADTMGGWCGCWPTTPRPGSSGRTAARIRSGP